LDPIDGYVVYSLLQNSGPDAMLSDEISEYRKIVSVKVGGYHSSDPLDLGMTLWTTSHWRETTPEDTAWSKSLTKSAVKCLRKYLNA